LDVSEIAPVTATSPFPEGTVGVAWAAPGNVVTMALHASEARARMDATRIGI
jgi:hypothetical protein